MIYIIMTVLREVLPEIWNAASWCILLNAAEETLSPDFGALCKQHLPAGRTRACLVFEMGPAAGKTLQVVVGRKGRVAFEITVEGRAAHAGSAHEQGANAILQLAQLVTRLEALTDYERGVTVNFGVIHGGTVTNVVPHAAAGAGEMRALDPQVFSETLERIRSLCSEATVRSKSDGVPCRIGFKITEQTGPWPLNDGSERLFAIWQEQGRELGLEVLRQQRGGLSDGNRLWHVYPTLDGLGPAGANCHCSVQSADGSREQEYLAVSSLVPKALLNVFAIAELVRGQ